MFTDALGIGIGFFLGKALFVLGFIALIGLVVGSVFGIAAVLDWRDRRRRRNRLASAKGTRP